MARILIVPLLLFSTVAGAGASSAIDSFQLALLEMATGNIGTFEQRYEKLAPVVESTHDLDFIARLTVGRYWTALDEQQREAFLKKFRQLAVSNYAARFARFDGKRFEIVEELAQPRNKVLVRTRLHLGDDKSLDFDYVLHETGDGWRIVNILVDGVSDLALKRAEYSAMLRDGEHERLLQTLDEQIERLRAAD